MTSQNEVNFQFLAEHNVDMICKVGLDLVMHYVSPSCLHILGWTPEEMCGHGPDVFVLPEDLPVVGAAHARLLINGVDKSPTTIRMRKKDGTFAWMEINARISKDEESGEADGIVLTMRDITERKLKEETLEALALRDSLTGLANRRRFDQMLEQEWRRIFRSKSQLSLILLDVDCFKQFNDQYGHLSGDDCLRAIANAAQRGAGRAADFVARYGGEEIAIILPETSSEGALAVAENIRAGIEALRLPHQGNPASEWVTVSLGVATALARYGNTGNMPESLLAAADRALYKAKQEGRNRIATSHALADQDTSL